MVMSEEPFCVEICRKNVGKLEGKMPASPSGDHVLDGNLGTCYKSHFVGKFTRKVPDPDSAHGILCGNLQDKTHMDISEESFCVEIYRKKRTWTFHKSRFVWKFTRKMAPDPLPTSIKHRPSVPFCKNPFQCGHTVWGTTRRTGNRARKITCFHKNECSTVTKRRFRKCLAP